MTALSERELALLCRNFEAPIATIQSVRKAMRLGEAIAETSIRRSRPTSIGPS